MKRLMLLCIGYSLSVVGQEFPEDSRFLRDLDLAIQKSMVVPTVILHAPDGEIRIHADSLIFRNSGLIQELRREIAASGLYSIFIPVSFADLVSFRDSYEAGACLSDFRIPASSLATIHLALRLPL